MYQVDPRSQSERFDKTKSVCVDGTPVSKSVKSATWFSRGGG